jgi:hypothetical protein
MKLIYEHNEVTGEVTEDLNEATGKSSKTYYISGTFSTIGEKNRNGRIYPKHIWEAEVAKYQGELSSNSINTLCEWEHPERTYVDPMNAIAKIVSLKVEGNKVVGKAKLLNNEKANQLKGLIDEGISIGVSSRGVGNVGKDGIVESFKLITYDCVAQPSDFNANTMGLTEGYIENGILMTEDYDIVDDKIVKIKICGKETCLEESRENVEQAIIEKFETLFGGKTDSLSEAKIDMSGTMFNGTPSADLQASYTKKGVLSLWVNGGSPYNVNVVGSFYQKVQDMGHAERQKIGQDIAVKVAKFIESEFSKLEK